MRHRLMLGSYCFAVVFSTITAAAAQDLKPVEIQGRNLVNQNCAVCHLKPQIGAKTYGPALNQETLAGNTDALRDFISMGTQRMPGFRYRFTVAQIDSISAYLKTVPATPAVTPANATQR